MRWHALEITRCCILRFSKYNKSQNSLRSKRFRRVFCPFEAFFAFWRRKNWGERNTASNLRKALRKRLLRRLKSKTILPMERKSSKEYSVVFLVDGKSSGYEFAFEDLIVVVGSAANSVGTTLEFLAFRSGPDGKYGRASAFCFILSTTMVFAAVRTHFPRKNTSIFMSIGTLSWEKKLVVK